MLHTSLGCVGRTSGCRSGTGSFFSGYNSPVAGDRCGASLDVSHDYDGDGFVDLVLGCPNTPGANNTQPGRAVVVSGAKLLAQTQPFELYT